MIICEYYFPFFASKDFGGPEIDVGVGFLNPVFPRGNIVPCAFHGFCLSFKVEDMAAILVLICCYPKD
jgi:hypothetical protein